LVKCRAIDSDMDAVRMMLNMNFGGDFKLSGDMRR